MRFEGKRLYAEERARQRTAGHVPEPNPEELLLGIDREADDAPPRDVEEESITARL